VGVGQGCTPTDCYFQKYRVWPNLLQHSKFLGLPRLLLCSRRNSGLYYRLLCWCASSEYLLLKTSVGAVCILLESTKPHHRQPSPEKVKLISCKVRCSPRMRDQRIWFKARGRVRDALAASYRDTRHLRSREDTWWEEHISGFFGGVFGLNGGFPS
jgi:hypothetical protein